LNLYGGRKAHEVSGKGFFSGRGGECSGEEEWLQSNPEDSQATKT
jgi:hypothetical protein